MSDLVIARALHVLAVVHWIGGVAMVTLVLLPALRTTVEPAARHELFERLEARFARQARISVTLVGLSGFYLVFRLSLWMRFAEPRDWWMHLMVLVWAVFSVVLFIAEPLFLHAWFRRRAAAAPRETFNRIEYAHRVLLTVSTVAVAAAVLGAHGGLA